MKLNATCTCATCGKTFVKTWDIKKSSERDSTIAYMQDRYTECADCYGARIKAESVAKSEAAGYAPMTGSEKQIAWAIKIREEKIERVLKHTRPEYADKVKAIIVEITADHSDARWWIDTRDDRNKALMDAIMAKFTA